MILEKEILLFKSLCKLRREVKMIIGLVDSPEHTLGHFVWIYVLPSSLFSSPELKAPGELIV